MRPSFVLLPVLPSAIALAACTPTVRTFSNGSGGGTTSSSSTSASSTSTGSSTSTSTSSGGPTATCTKVGAPFTILSSTDIGGSTLDDKPVLVPDPGQGGHPLVHVVVNAKSAGAMIVRSVSTDPTSPAGNMTTFGGGPPDAGSQPQAFQPASGWVTPGSQLFVEGALNVSIAGAGPVGLGQLAFAVDPYKGVMPMPTFSPYMTPSDCLQPGSHFGRIQVVQNGSDVHYVTACELPNNQASLWVGSGSGGPIQVGTTGLNTGVSFSPNVYGYLGGTNFIGFTTDGAMAGYLYGPDSTPGPVSQLVFQTGQVGLFFSAVPLLTNDGFALFAASVAPDLKSGSLWSGAVKLTDLSTLSQTPPPGMKQLLAGGTTTNIAPITNPTTDPDYIYSAGSTLDNLNVDFSLFQRDGTPLVFEQNVYKAPLDSNGTPTATIITAAAAPLGSPTVLVAWIEYDTSMNFSVLGQKLACM